MSEHATEPPADPTAELRRELETLKGELADLRSARTPEQKREAAEDVADAEADVVAAAKKAGLSPARYREALAAARRQSFLDDYGEDIDRRVEETLAKLLPEPPADPVAGNGSGGGSGGEDGADDKKPPPAPAGGGDDPPPPPAEDVPPRHPHWSERKVGELFK